MLGCMKWKFEQDRVSVASLTICLVQDEPQLLLERGLTAVAHLVQLFPPADSVPVSAVSQSNMTTLLNNGCSQTQTWLSGPQRHHCSSFLLIPHTHFCLPRHKPECTRMDYGLPETRRLQCYRDSPGCLFLCSASESNAGLSHEVTRAGRMTRLCMNVDRHFGNISFHRGIKTMQYDICDPHDQLLISLLETTV